MGNFFILKVYFPQSLQGIREDHFIFLGETTEF